MYALVRLIQYFFVGVRERQGEEYGMKPFGDPEGCPLSCDIVRLIEINIDEIKSSIDDLEEHPPIDRIQGRLGKDGWRLHWVKWYGKINKKSPDILRKICEVKGVSSLAVSRLKSGSDLSPHIGVDPSKVRLLYPIIVPLDAPSGLSVQWKDKIDTNIWKEGVPILFDDINMHYSWNRSCGDRVVLFLDLERELSGYHWLMKMAVDYLALMLKCPIY